MQNERNTFQDLGNAPVGQRGRDKAYNLAILAVPVEIEEFKWVGMDPAPGMISGVKPVQLVL